MTPSTLRSWIIAKSGFNITNTRWPLYALEWKNDHYYLIGNSHKHQRMAHFRIDHLMFASSEVFPELQIVLLDQFNHVAKACEQRSINYVIKCGGCVVSCSGEHRSGG